MKLIIIADDFTGANDTGVQFAKKNLSTIVTTKIDTISPSVMEKDILVMDTESRFDDADTAYNKVYHATKLIPDEGGCLIYKKLDSTFRGNIGAEISAVMDAAKAEYAVMVSALPSNGRTARNGHVYVNGVLLHETEVARDPKTPVNKSFIPDILKDQTEKKTAVIKRPEEGFKEEDVMEEIHRMREDGALILILDGETREDLHRLAKVCAKLPGNPVLIGTAGFAEFIPEAFNLVKKKGVLSIIGSVSDVTRKQITYAKKEADIKIMHFPINMMFKEEEKKEMIKDIIAGLKRGENLVIYTAENRDDVQSALSAGKDAGMDAYAVSDFIAKTLGEVTGLVMKEAGGYISGVYITGGDTLIKIADHLKISGMVIEDEVLPAIPAGRFLGDAYKDIRVVTKAGGFGQEDTFLEILRYLGKVK